VDNAGREAVEREWSTTSERVRRTTGTLAALGLLAMLGLCIPVDLLANEIVAGAAHYAVFVALMTVVLVPVMFVMGGSSVRNQERNHALAESLQRELVDALQAAERESQRREEQVRRQEFESRLANALEMAEGELEVLAVVEHALASTLPEAPVELLLADNSHAHLLRVATSSPTDEPPGCPVDSPDRCPAARRAQVQRFADSEEIDACPKLRDRPEGRCSATCVPVSIMGRTVGVLHATAAPGADLSDEKVHDLATLANLAGARIGLLRMMAETQLQAATDSLTGLLNRRTLEKQVHELRQSSTPFALVMADLDHFKELNDTYGHETGDRALRVFASTLRRSLRKEDVVCRHGGEEFAMVLPGCTAYEAQTSFDQIRVALTDAIARAGSPRFTASFGVVEAADDEDLVTLISRADAALFDAKHQGRDRVVVHDHNGHAVAAPGPTRALPAPLEAAPSS
jgi:diguanylate cyclase (GGDEF)-like protein